VPVTVQLCEGVSMRSVEREEAEGVRGEEFCVVVHVSALWEDGLKHG
jgi:hypothetical protein